MVDRHTNIPGFSMLDRTPRIAGAGLLALDVIICESGKTDALTFAGGTCGNVLSILSYLHWTSTPIGFLGDDPAGKRVLSDLATVGVRSAHLVQDADCATPVFIQRLEQDDDGPRHTFASTGRCPSCGQPSSQRKAGTNDGATPIRRLTAPEKVDVFFMDRLSEDILSLAESAKTHGALIFYEPSSKADAAHWASAAALVDIVKYAADRFEEHELTPFLTRRDTNDVWEVQTLGARGLRYRYHTKGSVSAQWSNSAAIPASRIVDTCGAGDWCSAGLLHGLITSGTGRDTTGFAHAIRLGQLLAAWACAFVGARGAMYCSDATRTRAAIDGMVESRALDASQMPIPAQSVPSKVGSHASCVPGLCADA